MQRPALLVAVGALVCAGARPAAARPRAALSCAGDAPLTPLFSVPRELAPAVAFWQALFLTHGSDHVLLHDRDDVRVVWQVLELPAATAASAAATAAAMQAAAAALRPRLERLAATRAPLDAADVALLRAATAARGGFAWEQAATRVRAQRGVAEQFRAGVQRAQGPLAEMRRLLHAAGVPAELAALPLIESMFDPQARSAVGAVGIWQLMPGTARELGLRIGRRHDQRRDVLPATRAAARLLAHNFARLNSWPLAITAYNFGAAAMQRAVSAAGAADLAYLVAHYQGPNWGFSAKNFYVEFLAAAAILADGRLAAPPPRAVEPPLAGRTTPGAQGRPPGPARRRGA